MPHTARHLLFLLLALALWVIAPYLAAQQTTFHPDDNDAARLLRDAGRQWRELQRSWYPGDGSPNEYDYIVYGDYDSASPETAARAIEQIQPIVNTIREAFAADEPPRFGINVTDGLNAALNHIAMVRSLIYSVRTDMASRILMGDHSRVADDLATMLDMSKVLQHDPYFISALTENALTAHTINVAAEAIDAGAVDQRAAGEILDRLNESIESDLFGYADRIASERDLQVEWMCTMNADAASRNDLVNALAESGGWQGSLIAQRYSWT